MAATFGAYTMTSGEGGVFVKSVGKMEPEREPEAFAEGVAEAARLADFFVGDVGTGMCLWRR